MAIPSGGYDSATISNPSSALTDFSLIIDLSRMSADWWGDVNTSDGTRGRASKSDGTTELACDWIDFDNAEETGLLRVKYSGSLASTGTQAIRIYPPNTTNATYSASNTYGSDNAYDGDWLLYWPDAGGVDRTSNEADGTSAGSVTTGGATGQIGSATTFDGSDDVVTSDSDIGAQSEITLMAWVNPQETADGGWIYIESDGGPSDAATGIRRDGTNASRCNVSDGTNNQRTDSSSASVPSSSWTHVASVCDLSYAPVPYIDGSSDIGSQGSSTITATEAGSFTAGYGDKGYANVSLNEVQVHSTDRSAAWVSQEYSQTDDQSTFWGTWTWTAGASSDDDCTASDLTGSAPTFDEPSVGQAHVLTASDLSGSGATFDEPTAGQVHISTADDLTGSAAVFDEPSVGQAHILTADDLTGSATTLDESTVGQTHIIAASEVFGSAATFDEPAAGTDDIDACTALDLFGAGATLDEPTVGQVHNLAGDDTIGGLTLFDVPALGQVHALIVSDLLGPVVVFDTPGFGLVQNLTADDLYGVGVIFDTPTAGETLFVHRERATINGGVTIRRAISGEITQAETIKGAITQRHTINGGI